MSTLTIASPDTLARMRNVARARQREATRRYSDHVMKTCRAECARGGVCRVARGLELEASAADWHVERLRQR